jgi:hypothetical protein
VSALQTQVGTLERLQAETAAELAALLPAGAHSDLGWGGFIGVSAAKMAFCTVGLERFPK